MDLLKIDSLVERDTVLGVASASTEGFAGITQVWGTDETCGNSGCNTNTHQNTPGSVQLHFICEDSDLLLAKEGLDGTSAFYRGGRRSPAAERQTSSAGKRRFNPKGRPLLGQVARKVAKKVVQGTKNRARKN